MTVFSTEFPLKPAADKSTFVALVYSWLRGSAHSHVFDDAQDAELDGDWAYFRSNFNEELRLRELHKDGVLEGIGFRHDLPDEDGRIWRTEAVLLRGQASSGQDLLRLRTQCVANHPGVLLSTPKKPYLVKQFIQDDLGGIDGKLNVSDQPKLLPDGEDGLEMAQSVVAGTASSYLPIIYVSAIDNDRWLLSERQIEKLAYDLGGVAHVLVERSRSFSFKLRDFVSNRNVYGGTIGLYAPNRGLVRRLFKGPQFQDSESLCTNLRGVCCALRTQMPAKGWDWTELQEQALRRQRLRERQKVEFSDIETLYLEEIENLKDRISQLEMQSDSDISIGDDDGQPRGGELCDAASLGIAEIYPGEVSDRVRLAVQITHESADRVGLDGRTAHILTHILNHTGQSPDLIIFLEDIKRAKDESELTAILMRNGYVKKAENKHVRLEASGQYRGLGAITMPKTPSDRRGLANMKAEIENVMGLTKIKKQPPKKQK